MSSIDIDFRWKSIGIGLSSDIDFYQLTTPGIKEMQHAIDSAGMNGQVNPFTPRSDQYINSPYNFNTL